MANKTRRQLLKESLAAFLLVLRPSKVIGSSIGIPNQVDSNKTFTDLYGDHLNNVVVFGNPDVPTEFQAHVKMQFWGEDTICLCEEGVKGTPILKDETIELDLGTRKMQWFKGDRPKWGSIHWKEILNEKPASNKWSLKISDGNQFNYEYQKPLSEIALDIPGSTIEYLKVEGFDGIRLVYPPGGPLIYDQRPLDVEGSYAVYHKTKHDNIVGHKNYRTGKVLQIPRPKAVDKNGNWVWCDIQVKDGIYTRTIPQMFLDTAVNPITINDTFGYWSTGASSSGMSADYMNAFGPWMGAAGSATSVHAAISGTTGTIPITLGIYDDSGSDAPDILERDTAGATENFTTTPAWISQNLDSALTISAKLYWIGWCNDTPSEACDLRYDANVGTDRDYKSYTYDSGVLANPFGAPSGGNDDRAYSVYITYTPTAGAAGQIIIIMR